MLEFKVHRPRPIRFLDVHEVKQWTVKLYGIAAAAAMPRAELVEATVAALAVHLPDRESDEPAVAFAIAHDAADYCFALIDWFEHGNEIHQRMLIAPLERPAELVPITGQAIGCVWELEVVDFERRAWLRHVLADPDGPQFDDYVATYFEGTL